MDHLTNRLISAFLGSFSRLNRQCFFYKYRAEHGAWNKIWVLWGMQMCFCRYIFLRFPRPVYKQPHLHCSSTSPNILLHMCPGFYLHYNFCSASLDSILGPFYQGSCGVYHPQLGILCACLLMTLSFGGSTYLVVVCIWCFTNNRTTEWGYTA